MANEPTGRVDRFHPAGNVPQPVCTDRFMVSYQRLERLALIADSVVVQAGSKGLLVDAAYAQGVVDVLTYLIERTELSPELAALLDIEE